MNLLRLSVPVVASVALVVGLAGCGAVGGPNETSGTIIGGVLGGLSVLRSVAAGGGRWPPSLAP